MRNRRKKKRTAATAAKNLEVLVLRQHEQTPYFDLFCICNIITLQLNRMLGNLNLEKTLTSDDKHDIYIIYSNNIYI